MPLILSRRALLVAAILALTAPTVVAQDSAIVGAYAVAGVNADGTKYDGIVDIEQSGDVYLLSWSFGAQGMGLLRGDVLSVIFTTGQWVGLAVYRVERKDDGLRLIGTWIAPPEEALASEILAKVKPLRL